jgi:hypothetical protein
MRSLPLWAGFLGGILLLVNRSFSPVLLPSQARADVLGIVLSAVLVLIGLLWQQIQPKPPDAVTLLGRQVFDLDPELDAPAKTELAWASHVLLTNTVTQCVVLWWRGRVVVRRGIFPEAAPPCTLGAIAQRASTTQKPIYLVSLPLYPGRTEFDFLPANTQGVIVQPLESEGVLILGANVPRSYTKQDEQWIAAIAQKLHHTLSHGDKDLP